MAHLQGGKVDISLIQTSARNNLINLLEKCPGKKAIVWDNNLAGPVGLVAQYTILREHMVTKMYPLRPTPLPETDVDHVIFISRPKEYTIENDPTYLYQTAQAIIYLQKIYGPIPRVWGKGDAAKQIWELVVRLQREKNNIEEPKSNQPSCIDQILLIDRCVDLISPLATQLTYEGLIDEIFGINNSTANFPIDHFLTSEERSTESLAEDKKQIILNSADKLYADIRDRNFNAEKSVQEMKLYVQRLPQILAKKKQLATHTAIAECVKEVTDSYDFLDTLQAEQEFLNCIEVDKPSAYIEEMVAQNKPLVKVLRLMCLQCIAGSGLKPKVLESYKRDLVQVYGLEALLAVTKLEKVGLLKLQSGTRQYTVLRKALHLTMEDTSEVNPTDISYVHSIYAPLSIRLAEQVTRNGGLKQLQDVLGLLPGPTLDESPSVSTSLISNTSDAPTISALRFLSQQEDSNVEFVIATTKIINGTTFLKSIIEN
ncbi:hypothetical protein NQ314_002467 [Rhamnusium bicolor]|uniref:Vacuolar protein sorting-associated protein 33A n=1 Tax=Rhamnusium bicolor TaxID=1586634 RepID=A0AAV8ZP80_9CUCU|nr:hypothetical protein NQ314_002467 [Rhamnusium bicolor]